jgi:phage FluMu gp28-like protein
MNLDPRSMLKTGQNGDYYGGVDLGQKHDYTVVAVVEKKDGQITLRHIKRFPLGTEYTTILGYLKVVQEKLQTVRGFYIDQTGVGEVFVENARKHGLHNVQGIVLTMPMKQEVMTNIKQGMQEKRLHIPRDRPLEIEMNGEIAELTSTGKTKFYHRTGTHDDRLWAVALAVYGARHDVATYHPVAIPGRHVGYIGPRIERWRLRPGGRPPAPLPGEPAALYRVGHLWCLACGQAFTTRPHRCGKPPS